MSSSTSASHAISSYTTRHASWPYSPSDFTRQDSSVDSSFYSSPRFVTHIDDGAIASLRAYYETSLPRQGRILDFCSSWVSHYPEGIESAAKTGQLQVIGMGMNKAELDANKVLNNGRLLVDLNDDTDVAKALVEAKTIGPSEEEKLSASTCVVSIDYLTRPVEVLRSLRDATRTGGSVHLAISNRCFPTKAISRWLRVDEQERLLMVGDFLHFAGWQKIEIVDLSPKQDNASQAAASQNVGRALFDWFGMRSGDPIWVVRAVKE